MTSIVKLSVWYVASDLYKCERIRLQKTHTSADVLFWRLGWGSSGCYFHWKVPDWPWQTEITALWVCVDHSADAALSLWLPRVRCSSTDSTPDSLRSSVVRHSIGHRASEGLNQTEAIFYSDSKNVRHITFFWEKTLKTNIACLKALKPCQKYVSTFLLLCVSKDIISALCWCSKNLESDSQLKAAQMTLSQMCVSVCVCVCVCVQWPLCQR